MFFATFPRKQNPDSIFHKFIYEVKVAITQSTVFAFLNCSFHFTAALLIGDYREILRL